MPVMRPIPQVMDADLDQSGFPSPLDNTVLKRSPEKFRENGEHVKFHVLSPIFDRPPAINLSDNRPANPSANSFLKLQQTLREIDTDHLRLHIDFPADGVGEGDQNLTAVHRLNLQQRRTAVIFYTSYYANGYDAD